LKEENGYLKIEGTDNHGISGYAISKSETSYSYSTATMLKYNDYGTWYGYVRDYAGNKARCEVNIKKPITEIDPTNITIIGDSRMAVGLCYYNWYKTENGKCIAKSAEGYEWFYRNAIYQVAALNSDKKKYIVTNLGVNDLYNKQKYMDMYSKLATKDWKDSMIFLLSVNPTSGKADKLNSDINKFNDALKNLATQYSNMSYCDTNSYLKQIGFQTVNNDGVHYVEGINKIIYEKIKKCIYDYYN